MTHAYHNKPVIGIVGGIGAGKSLTSAKFAELGCVVVSGDEIGHELLRDADVAAEVVRQWGDGVLDADGQIDRSALGRIAFDAPGEMAKLTGILHPRIRSRMTERIAAAQTDAAAIAVVVDAAVLFEAGWDDLCDCVVFVDAPRAVRLARVAEVKGWDQTALTKRERLQIELDKKRQMCDYVIDNHVSDSRLSETLRQLLDRIVSAKDRSKAP
jgi:dephospho-CoA kinase